MLGGTPLSCHALRTVHTVQTECCRNACLPCSRPDRLCVHGGVLRHGLVSMATACVSAASGSLSDLWHPIPMQQLRKHSGFTSPHRVCNHISETCTRHPSSTHPRSLRLFGLDCHQRCRHRSHPCRTSESSATRSGNPGCRLANEARRWPDSPQVSLRTTPCIGAVHGAQNPAAAHAKKTCLSHARAAFGCTECLHLSRKVGSSFGSSALLTPGQCRS